MSRKHGEQIHPCSGCSISVVERYNTSSVDFGQSTLSVALDKSGGPLGKQLDDSFASKSGTSFALNTRGVGTAADHGNSARFELV